MSDATRKGALVMAEIFKALRFAPMSAGELGEYLCMTPKAAHCWLHELEANGMVSVETQQRGLGRATHVYRLAAKWGGKA